jgi:hypothetical protein
MIIMEAILSASALLYGRAAQSVGRSVVRTFKRWRAVATRVFAVVMSVKQRDVQHLVNVNTYPRNP